MRCNEVQNVLVGYLDGEITPAERALIQEHISRCDECQAQLAALAATQNNVKRALHYRADLGTPSSNAWSQLQVRLAQESRQQTGSCARRIPIPSLVWLHQLSGGITMYKSVFLAVLVVIVAAAIAIGYLPHNTTSPVSAQDILDRAYVRHQTAQQPHGIHHTQTEVYYNYAVMGKAGISTENTSLIESYLDYQTNWFRSVITDKDTGTLMSVSAYDGTYLYSTVAVEEQLPSDHVTIYRMPQSPDVMSQWGVAPGTIEVIDAERMFEAMRNDPNTELLGQESWLDGRTVYVLRTSGIASRVQPGSDADFTTMYFDAETYRLLENRVTVELDGQEVIVSYNRFLVDEVLPADTMVVWDLSDLENVVFEDDLDGELANLTLPEPVSLDELLALTPSVYVLQTMPDGFVVEISVSVSQDEPLYYMIAYHDQDGNHLVLQADAGAEKVLEQAEETYTTASGLVLHFVRESSVPGSDREYTTALVEAPDGISFLLSSNLPHEQVLALAEDLILASAATP